MHLSIEEVYYISDEIVKKKMTKKVNVGRKNTLSASELITILVEGHRRGLTTIKQIYTMLTKELHPYFPHIPVYSQFCRSISKVQEALDMVLNVLTHINASHAQEFCTVDSSSLPVNGYNKKHTKWATDAGIGKNMHGFYQGFKLHIIINQNHEIISIETTKANVHDVQLLKQENFVKPVKGTLVGDKGYILSIQDQDNLKKMGINLIAKQRENMDPYLNIFYAGILKKRRQIEHIFGCLKEKYSLILPHLRSTKSFLVNVKAAVFSFMLRKFNPEELCF